MIGPKGPRGPQRPQERQNYTPHPDYQNLPEGIKADLSEKDYAWLDDESRRNLIRDMTNPEVAED
jgi:hypothetical protein